MPTRAGRISTALESGKVKVDRQPGVDYKFARKCHSLIINMKQYFDGENMKTDIKTLSVDLYFIPVQTRIPLKFGPETLTSVICARTCITVADGQGQTAQGWGEPPV